MNKLVFWSLIFIVLTGGVIVAIPRGIKNNNPMNIRLSSDVWNGLKSRQTDSSFFQFKESVFGIRAGAKLLLNYERLYGLNTIEDIISRFAPTVENDTASYIYFVSNNTGFKPRDILDVRASLPKLIAAIIKFENGINPYSDEQILNGIALI